VIETFEKLKNEIGNAWSDMKTKIDEMMQDLQKDFDQTETQT
jgi:hypothetical protein